MAVANPPPLVPIAGASDREGRSRRNRHHWIALSRGIIPIYFFLIIAAPQGFNFVPFSGSLQYGNATRLQADDGSDRGPARGLFRWAKASVGSGDRRRRASSARGPSPTSFWRFGPDKGTSIDFGQATRAAGAAAARLVEGVSVVRAAHPALYLTHARAFATHRCGVDGCARGRRSARAAERGRLQRRGHRGEGGGVMGSKGVDGVEQGASTGAAREAEGDDEDEATDGRAPSTGLGPRGMVVRYCPSGCESVPECARAC